jgi:hypothetical protein
MTQTAFTFLDLFFVTVRHDGHPLLTVCHSDSTECRHEQNIVATTVPANSMPLFLTPVHQKGRLYFFFLLLGSLLDGVRGWGRNDCPFDVMIRE